MATALRTVGASTTASDKGSIVSNLQLIRRVQLFSMLTDSQAQIVADAVTKRRYKRGEAIVEQGKRSGAMSIILTGRARVVTTDSRGREVILAMLHPGDCIGEMSLIDKEPHSASVLGDIQTDVLVLTRADLAGFLPESGSMAHAIMNGLVQRLRQADRKIESLALMDVYGRVARVLIEASVKDAQGQSVITSKVSRQDVAKMVGASREMVSRVMKDLEERGFIETRADHSVLLKERLSALS